MLLEPLEINKIRFKNRVVMPPMCMYSVNKKDGIITDFHKLHYQMRALGGVGTIILESTGIEPKGRITENDLGLWNNQQAKKLAALVKDLKSYGAVVGIQINHAGRKAQIDDQVGVGTLPYFDDRTPKTLTTQQVKKLVKKFKESAIRAHVAGFDLLEIHAAHGYLIHQFLSPITNNRKDVYGKDRALFLKEIVKEIREVWPKDKVLQLRMSATDYIENSVSLETWIPILDEIKQYIDVVNVSTGGLVLMNIDDYPGYQISYAETIKKQTGLMVCGGGLIESFAYGDQIAKQYQLDFVYFGRLLLRDPFFLLKESKIDWPLPYIRAKKK